MSRTLYSPRYVALRKLLVEKRKAAGLTQAALAKRVGRYQSFVADFERSERRLDVVDFIEFAEALDLDPAKIIKALSKLRR